MGAHPVDFLPTFVGVTQPETSMPASRNRFWASSRADLSAVYPSRKLSTNTRVTPVCLHQSMALSRPASLDKWLRTSWAVNSVEILSASLFAFACSQSDCAQAFDDRSPIESPTITICLTRPACFIDLASLQGKYTEEIATEDTEKELT